MSDNIITKSYKVNMDKWFKCGNFAINKNTLKKKRLTVKYWKNLNTLQSYPPLRKVLNISTECVDFLSDCLVNKDKFDFSKFMTLNNEEQNLIIYLFDKSKFGTEITFNFSEAYRTRFKIIQGEIATGNDNPILIKEGIDVVKKLMEFHIIPFSQGEEMIGELQQILK